ncbi:MAG TPA: hypothetical protein GX513_01600 [Firmicutes bacterium]|nr:hypothetical protein [Bacillota bacterium]
MQEDAEVLTTVLEIARLMLIATVSRASGIDGRTGQVPVPAGVSPEAEYQPPEELPGTIGGPLVGEEAAKDAALGAARAQAQAGTGYWVEHIILARHGTLVGEGVFSPAFSVADSRQVCLVTVGGEFTFGRQDHCLAAKVLRGDFLAAHLASPPAPAPP